MISLASVCRAFLIHGVRDFITMNRNGKHIRRNGFCVPSISNMRRPCYFTTSSIMLSTEVSNRTEYTEKIKMIVKYYKVLSI